MSYHHQYHFIQNNNDNNTSTNPNLLIDVCKNWYQRFLLEHNRTPTKLDLNEDPAIRELFNQLQHLSPSIARTLPLGITADELITLRQRLKQNQTVDREEILSTEVSERTSMREKMLAQESVIREQVELKRQQQQQRILQARQQQLLEEERNREVAG